MTNFKTHPDPKKQMELIRQGIETNPPAPEPYRGPVVVDRATAKPWTSIEDQLLKKHYIDKGPAWIAEQLGRSVKSVIARRARTGIVPTTVSPWTDRELLLLRAWYREREGKPLDLDSLARILNRLRSNICRKARELQLTNTARTRGGPRDRRQFKTTEELRAHQSQVMKARIDKSGHPRGAKGMKHSQQAKRRISETSRAAWSTTSAKGKRERTERMMVTKAKNGVPINIRGKWKADWREIGGKRKYFRSRWEANYARYLQWQKDQGEIIEWEHEPETFWFKGLKRGCVSYLPDFRVTGKDGKTFYVEVKGWMDARSKTKIKRMRKYYPAERLVVVDSKAYSQMSKSLRGIVQDWE